MQPTAEITHPQKPEVSVTVRIPRQAQRLELEQMEQRARHVPSAVYEADGKTPITKKNGDVQVFVLEAPTPIVAETAYLKAYIVGMTNVPTIDGGVLNFQVEKAKEQASARDAAIAEGVLWDDHLNVSLSVAAYAAMKGITVDDKGEKYPDDVFWPVPFAKYIISKAVRRDTYDQDPSGNA